MSNIVEQHLIHDSGLQSQDLQEILGLIHQYDNDYADLYFQSSQHESWVLEDGIIREGSYNLERGVGVRAVSGEKTGFAYSDVISKEALSDAAKAARSISAMGGNQQVKVFANAPTERTSPIYPPWQKTTNCTCCALPTNTFAAKRPTQYKCR